MSFSVINRSISHWVNQIKEFQPSPPKSQKGNALIGPTMLSRVCVLSSLQCSETSRCGGRVLGGDSVMGHRLAVKPHFSRPVWYENLSGVVRCPKNSNINTDGLDSVVIGSHSRDQ